MHGLGSVDDKNNVLTVHGYAANSGRAALEPQTQQTFHFFSEFLFGCSQLVETLIGLFGVVLGEGKFSKYFAFFLFLGGELRQQIIKRLLGCVLLPLELGNLTTNFEQGRFFCRNLAAQIDGGLLQNNGFSRFGDH